MREENGKTILLSFIAIFLVAVISVLSYFFIFSESKITVPDFNNKNIEEVNEIIKDKKIPEKNYNINYEYNETVEKDMVISQSIDANKKISNEEIIIINISNGYDPNLMVTIPDFNGKNEDFIKDWFNNNKFTDINYEYIINEKPKGEFVSLNVQDLNQKRSSLIVVSISAGKDAVGLDIEIPDFKDYTKANIQAWAKTNNINVKFLTEPSTTVKEGKVIFQKPKAQEKIKTGSNLTVTLSSGNASIETFNFAGKSKSEAEKFIKSKSLKATYIQVYDANIKPDIIVSNEPNKGSIKQNSTVKFYVSIGLVPIENYTGKNIDEFDKYISKLNSSYNSSAKIKVNKIYEESNQPENRILAIVIYDKNIGSKTYVAPNSQITVKVAKKKIENVKVDNKVGISEAEFKKYISGLKLNIGNVTQKYDDKPSGTILYNDNGTFNTGSSINYTISLGKFTINTDSYKNKSYSSLVNVINDANSKNAGYTISKTEVSNNDIQAGNIISCSLNNKSINCNVSKGKPLIVPNFVGGLKPNSCPERCSLNGINIVIKYENSNGVEVNKVIKQSVQANTEIDSKTIVELTVSTGPAPTPTPSQTPTSTPTVAPTPTPTPDTKMCRVPSLNILSVYDGNNFDDASRNIKNALSEFNVNIIEVSGDNNPDNYNGRIKSVSNKELSGKDIDCNTTFTVEIFKSN